MTLHLYSNGKEINYRNYEPVILRLDMFFKKYRGVHSNKQVIRFAQILDTVSLLVDEIRIIGGGNILWSAKVNVPLSQGMIPLFRERQLKIEALQSL